jgi:protein TonB
MKQTILLSAILFMTFCVHAQDTGNISKSQDKQFYYIQKMPYAPYNVDQYLADNLKYPGRARRQKIQGRVIVRFVINEDGSISDCKIIKGIGGGCDEVALKVIQNMPKWSPGKQEGKPVKVFFTKAINFTLSD